MKTLSIFFFAIISLNAWAQAPTGFKYQAVLRDAAGQAKANSTSLVAIRIVQGNAAGQAVYTENHHATATETGLINLTIGEGNDRSNDLATIDWSAGPYFLEVSIDGQLYGASQLMSVPYALYALKAGTIETTALSADSAWNISGNTGTNANNFLGTKDQMPLVLRTDNIPYLRLTTRGQLEQLNTGHSVYLGEGAGVNDDQVVNDNVYIGYQSGFSGVTASQNTSVGWRALYQSQSSSANTAIGTASQYSNINGRYNVSVGAYSLYHSTSASDNIAIGHHALYANTSGSVNTAVGTFSLADNLTGAANTTLGFNTLRQNNTGSNNTALGQNALYSNTYYNNNTAVGAEALYRGYGPDNTAIGYKALFSSSGWNNVALGSFCLSDNYGFENAAVGAYAMYKNEGKWNSCLGSMALFKNAGSFNSAIGFKALFKNTEGNDNTALGVEALFENTQGSRNTAVGMKAMQSTSGERNTAVGYAALSWYGEGNYNTAVGYAAFQGYSHLTNATAIGAGAQVYNSNEVRIGNVSATKIGGQVNWTAASDGRFKTDIREDVPGLEFIQQLRPVTYRVNHDVIVAKNASAGVDASAIPKDLTVHTGFIAQEVEAAARKVNFDFSGVSRPERPEEWYSLRYAEFVVPLVKAVQEQQTLIDSQRQLIEALTQRVQALEGKSTGSGATGNTPAGSLTAAK
ncbi:tail fiber domain-containing protein [Parachryseolinea silvisoli]|uniref:tail fiber domain-containing protein n=1 Tax=Parachryseolinea silvisoli TaxID=2873601 RepID=UPI002265D9EC|nr:tail fiber domain-containing protein [Parachryseolinea silvisoli]MCD9015793.1 tail fiber domain-containing protein [Parachryseolinea silvisoli]